MDLKIELDAFLRWLAKMVLPGFRTFCDDTYFDESYRTVSEELENLGTQMKAAVVDNNDALYSLCKAKYLEIFEQVNTQLATTHYKDLVDRYLDEDYDHLGAETAAVSSLWSDERFRRWLPVKLRMPHSHENQEVFIVASEHHIPQEGNYVLLTELEYLMKSGRDPWEYVSNRKAA